MKCSNCGKEVMTPNHDQSVDEYINIKKCSNCGNFGKWEIMSSKIE